MRSKIKTKKILLLLIPFFILIGLLQIFNIISNTNKIFAEYPMIRDEEEISCKVSLCKQFKGTSLIVDDLNNKYSVKAYSKNLNPSSLFEYCEEGDSLIRAKGSQVLILIKNNSGNAYKFDVVIME